MEIILQILKSFPLNMILVGLLVINWCVNIELWKAYNRKPSPPASFTAVFTCYMEPVNQQRLLQVLISMAENDNPKKAQMALKRIGSLGAKPQAIVVMPRLEEIALNHDDEEARRLAREAIEIITKSNIKEEKIPESQKGP